MSLGIIHGFDWDNGNWPKCGKHGVSKGEIEFILENEPQTYLDPDYSKNEQRYRAIGKNISGRYILIAFTFRKFRTETYLRPISARFMHQKEIDFYAGK
jgi:uncharacterized protein